MTAELPESPKPNMENKPQEPIETSGSTKPEATALPGEGKLITLGEEW